MTYQLHLIGLAKSFEITCAAPGLRYRMRYAFDHRPINVFRVLLLPVVTFLFVNPSDIPILSPPTTIGATAAAAAATCTSSSARDLAVNVGALAEQRCEQRGQGMCIVSVWCKVYI
jgi:hypothetical protein